MFRMLKRDGILFLRGFIPALILVVLLGIACVIAALSASKGAAAGMSPVKVALVDEEDSTMSRISIGMVTDQEYISSLMKFEKVTYDEAMKGMSDGTFAAAVILPDGYVDSIMHGKDCTGTIYVSEALQSEEQLIESVADFGARLLAAGQYGVFAGEKVIENNNLPQELHEEYLDASNSKLITFALEAYGRVFTFEELPYSNTGMSYTDYYIAAWLAFIIFVCGLFFPDLYIADCKGSIYGRLQSVGIGKTEFMLGKILYPALFRTMLLVPAALILKIDRIWLFVLAGLFATFITSCLAVSMSKKGGWVVLILAISSISLFLVGGLLPRAMLPRLFIKINEYTPGGVAFEFIRAAFAKDSVDLKAYVIAGLYVLLMIIITSSALTKLSHSNEEVRL